MLDKRRYLNGCGVASLALGWIAGGMLAGGLLGCERAAEPSAAELVEGSQRVEIKADTSGFQPSTVRLRQGTPAVLAFTRVVDSDCVDAVKMPWLEKPVDLPLHETVEIAVDTSKAGTFTYACWMNMVFGRVVIEAP